jgi:hypothetical protein
MRNQKHRAKRREYCYAQAKPKRKYLTREDASHEMGKLTRDTGTLGLCVYSCRTCGEFHLGHMTERVRAKFGFTG